MIKIDVRLMRSISQFSIHGPIIVHKKKQHIHEPTVYPRTIFPSTRQLEDNLSNLMTLTIIAW